MRTIAAFVIALVFSSFAAHAETCVTAKGPKGQTVLWRVDRYVYDAPLHRDWKVLVNCDHPDAPPRIELLSSTKQMQDVEEASGTAPGASLENANSNMARGIAAPACVKAGEIVEVLSGTDAPVRISMRGTAMQSAFPGQKIRIRLSANGKFVSAIVRGPHSVELVAVSQAAWRKP